MKDEKNICIIIPVYNGKKWLSDSVNAVKGAMLSLNRDYGLIIAEDGSTDGSFELAKSLEGEHVRVVHSDKRLGKGNAIGKAILSTKSDIVVFIDVDLSANLRYLGLIILAVEQGADIAIASRLVKGSKIHNTRLMRGFLSRIYNLFIRLLFRTGISDHQCGFKGFRRASIVSLLGNIRNGGWFWDTELIVRAKRKELKITEIPIEWTDSRESSMNLFYDIPSMAFAAIRLRLELR